MRFDRKNLIMSAGDNKSNQITLCRDGLRHLNEFQVLPTFGFFQPDLNQ